MSAGSCWPSASRSTAYLASAARAAFMSVATAAPLPMFCGCLMTRAPASSASFAVLSAEPSSATITRSTYFFASRTTAPTRPSSLYAGMRATASALGRGGSGGGT